MFDTIVKDYGGKETRQLIYHVLDLLHQNKLENQETHRLLFLLIKKQNKMSQDFDDLKLSIDAVKQDLSDIKDKVAAVIAKLNTPGGMTAEEKQALKDELSDIHGTAGQVESNLDAAVNPPAPTPEPTPEPPVV